MKPVTLFLIPPGSTPERCASCPALIYKVRNEQTRNIAPLAVAPALEYKGQSVTTHASAPTETRAGSGYSHFLDCPRAAAHRRRGRR